MAQDMRSIVAIILLSFALLAGFKTDALAGNDELYDEAFTELTFYTVTNPFTYIDNLLKRLSGPEKSDAALASKPITGSATFRMPNFNATLEKGEPTEGGKMKKTVWGGLSLPDNGRVVVHTFGSGFDTVLAAYSGTELKKLKRVAGNDDTPAGSQGKGGSLVQFDAKKGVEYRLQIGSKTGAEGDAFVSVFLHPPAGGLSAFLVAAMGNSTWWGRDFACGSGGLPSCTSGPATFLVHNSTDKEVTVEASHTLGAGVDRPADFTLKPGEVKEASFSFGGGFDTTKPRTVAGFFVFTAKQGGKTVAEARSRALIVMKPLGQNLDDVLQVAVTPAVQAGNVGEALAFDVDVKNTGAKAAAGCHARGANFSQNKVVWESSGDVWRPFDIAKGKSRSFRIWVASQESRIADRTFPGAGDIVIDCNNTQAAAIDLSNNLDFTARGTYRPAKIASRLLAKGDTLKVPRSGEATFEVEAENESGDATIVARAQYVRPFVEGDPKELFEVSVCRLEKPKGKCLGAAAESLEYSSKKRSKAAFRVFVKAPKKDPGLDPGLRRVFLILSQKQPIGFVYSVPVAAESMAPRKQ